MLFPRGELPVLTKQQGKEVKLANALTATQHVQLTGTNGLALYDGQMAVRVTLQPR